MYNQKHFRRGDKQSRKVDYISAEDIVNEGIEFASNNPWDVELDEGETIRERMWKNVAYNMSQPGEAIDAGEYTLTYIAPNCVVTSLENYERFCETGDDQYLGDIKLDTAEPGTIAILSWEGGDRAITIGSH